MKHSFGILLFFLLCQASNHAQTTFHQRLSTNYERYKEQTLVHKRFKHADLMPLIEKRNKNSIFNITKVGGSVEERAIYTVKVGTGNIKVLLWSQMHGDEPTATMALMDMLNFFEQKDEFDAIRKQLLNKLSIYMLPMLNPDGAERFQRQNVMGVDLNRDALRLENPESRILKQVHTEVQPDWGFNLHDQSSYYAVGNTDKPATISFLAPAYNQQKEVNETRGDAMKLIVLMNKMLQKYIPGQVAKYADAFEPRAFGDNIQKWGTRTILIESGGHYNDPEKQFIRKMNFLTLMTALEAIASGDYTTENLNAYKNIPFNKNSLYDLILREVQVNDYNKKFKLDIAINRLEEAGEENTYFTGKVAYIGDLSIFPAYQVLKANSYELEFGAVHPQVFETVSEAQQTPWATYHEKGYLFVRVSKMLPLEYIEEVPIQFILMDELVQNHLALGMNPSFFLTKNGRREYAVVNGKLYNLLALKN